MELNDFELEILSGKHGEPRRLAIEHQIQIGKFFDAKKLIEISQAHIMADTEALGLSGIQFLEIYLIFWIREFIVILNGFH